MRSKQIFWFTGQPGAGKTVLAKMLKLHLEDKYGDYVFHIDGDDLRSMFKNLNYGKEGREENIKRAQDIAKFINAKGYDVVVSLVAPYKHLRENYKEELGGILKEIYVHTTNERGREHFHIEEYEKPTENFIDINTTDIKPIESLTQILKQNGMES